MGVGESTFRLVDLQTRQSQIHERGIDMVNAVIIQGTGELVERRMHGNEPVGKPFGFHTFRGERQSLGVTVDADQTRLRCRLQESGGVTGKPQRAIHYGRRLFAR